MVNWRRYTAAPAADKKFRGKRVSGVDGTVTAQPVNSPTRAAAHMGEARCPPRAAGGVVEDRLMSSCGRACRACRLVVGPSGGQHSKPSGAIVEVCSKIETLAL